MSQYVRTYAINVSTVDDRELVSVKTGERFSFSAVLSQLIPFKDLFVHHESLPSGRRTSSLHRHSHREEMVFVLEGNPKISPRSLRTSFYRKHFRLNCENSCDCFSQAMAWEAEIAMSKAGIYFCTSIR